VEQVERVNQLPLARTPLMMSEMKPAGLSRMEDPAEPVPPSPSEEPKPRSAEPDAAASPGFLARILA